MDRTFRIGFALLFGLTTLAGCGSSSSSDAPGQAAAPAAQNASTAPAPSTEEIAAATSDFLEAVLKGDSQRASSRLTPQAIQRIAQSGMPFAPPGLETASFKIGEVRTPSPDQAVVQCVLTDTSSPEQAQSEEICCLLRRVDNDWRVSGIAYGTAPDKPWTLSNFETGKSSLIQRQTAPPAMNTSVQSEAGRPSPPYTANQADPAAVR